MIRRLAALALVVALAAQAVGPAFAATMLGSGGSGREHGAGRQEHEAGRPKHGAGRVAGSAGHAADHHHAGCPWRERGPCPHEAAPEGAVLTSCDAPAAATATSPPGVATSPDREALFPPVAFATTPFPPADRAGRSTSRLLDPPPPRALSLV
jgi:hypothetical protein